MGHAQNPQNSHPPASLNSQEFLAKAFEKLQSLTQDAESMKAILLNELGSERAELQELQERMEKLQTSKAEKERQIYDLESRLRRVIEMIATDACAVLKPEPLGSYVS